jgi:hypothetical protein
MSADRSHAPDTSEFVTAARAKHPGAAILPHALRLSEPVEAFVAKTAELAGPVGVEGAIVFVVGNRAGKRLYRVHVTEVK